MKDGGGEEPVCIYHSHRGHHHGHHDSHQSIMRDRDGEQAVSNYPHSYHYHDDHNHDHNCHDEYHLLHLDKHNHPHQWHDDHHMKSIYYYQVKIPIFGFPTGRRFQPHGFDISNR